MYKNLKKMEIKKETTKYNVSHSAEDINVNGTFNILYDKLDYVRLIATIASNIGTNPITSKEIGMLEYKAIEGEPKINVSHLPAFAILLSVFEDIKNSIK